MGRIATGVLLALGLTAIVVAAAPAGATVTLDASQAGDVTNWALSPTGANSRAAGSLTVTATGPYTLSVTFDHTRMTEWNTGAQAYVAGGRALGAPLTVLVARAGGTAALPTVTTGAVSGSSSLLATGPGLGSDTYAVSLAQPTALTDPALPSTGRSYHMVLTFTAASSLG
jgi:hypothetical protein